MTLLNHLSNDKQKQNYLFILVAAALLYGIVHMGGFFVPESDFFDFRDKAIAFRNLELPENIKRMPLYSICIALVSLLLPVAERELYAAGVINLAACLFSLFFIFQISRNYFGKFAFFIAWLFAINPLTNMLVTAPKSEMLTLVFVTGAFYFHLKKSHLCYFFAALASLTRYEGALLIPAFFLHDLFEYRKLRLKSLFYSLFAASGVGFWIYLNSQSTGSINPYGFYFKTNMTFIPHKFLSVLFGNLAILPYASLTKYAVICLSVLSFVGCGYLWFQFKNRSIAIILFYFAYIIFHSLYPSVIPEYTLNVQWIGHIFIFAGAAFISSLVPDKNVISTFLSKLSIRSVRILAISSTWLIILLYVIKQGVASYGGILFGSIAVAYFMHIWDFHIKLDTIKVLIVLIAVLFAIRQDALTRKKLFHLKYAKAEYRLVGEWYKDNYRPGDRMVINQPTIANYYSNLKKSDYIAFSEFKSTNMDDFIQELGEKKASFMAVVYHDNPQDKESDGIYQWRYKYQKLYLLEQLFDGQSYGHFELLEKLTAGHRWAYIYRIQRHDNYFTNGEYKSESAH